MVYLKYRIKVKQKGEIMKISELQKMSIDELANYHSLVTQVYKEKIRHKQATIALKFHVGDTVAFDSRRSGRVYGTVKKVNRKTIIVKENSGYMTWKVSPSLLTKMN